MLRRNQLSKRLFIRLFNFESCGRIFFEILKNNLASIICTRVAEYTIWGIDFLKWKFRVIAFETLLDVRWIQEVYTKEDKCVTDSVIICSVWRLKFRFVVLLRNINMVIGIVEPADPFEEYFISLFLSIVLVVLESHYLRDHFSLGG